MTTSQLQAEQHQLSDDTAISIQNVTISYGSYEAVKNVYCDQISFTVILLTKLTRV